MAPSLTRSRQAQFLGTCKQNAGKAGNISPGQFQGKKHAVRKKGIFCNGKSYSPPRNDYVMDLHTCETGRAISKTKTIRR